MCSERLMEWILMKVYFWCCIGLKRNWWGNVLDMLVEFWILVVVFVFVGLIKGVVGLGLLIISFGLMMVFIGVEKVIVLILWLILLINIW